MSIFSICKHTVHESFESGNRKPTDNVTEIHCHVYVKMSVIWFSACWSLEPVKTSYKFVLLFSCSCS